MMNDDKLESVKLQICYPEFLTDINKTSKIILGYSLSYDLINTEIKGSIFFVQVSK